MGELFSSFWTASVRAGPVLLGVLAFAVINGMRRWFHLQYMPTYFSVFPLSLLDSDLARFSGMGWTRVPETPRERQRFKRQFLGRATMAGLLSFVMIPMGLGFVAAFYMNPTELLVTIAILIVWQGYASYQSTTDNARYSTNPVASTSFFAILYGFYLVSLAGFMYRGFAFGHPYIVSEEWVGLVTALWEAFFTLVVSGAVLAVLSGIMVYLITERDIL